MIELTPEQRKSIQEGGAVRVRENGQEYVLLRPEVFDRLTEDYEDSPWDPEEMDRMREESVALLDNFGKESADVSVSIPNPVLSPLCHDPATGQPAGAEFHELQTDSQTRPHE